MKKSSNQCKRLTFLLKRKVNLKMQRLFYLGFNHKHTPENAFSRPPSPINTKVYTPPNTYATADHKHRYKSPEYHEEV